MKLINAIEAAIKESINECEAIHTRVLEKSLKEWIEGKIPKEKSEQSESMMMVDRHIGWNACLADIRKALGV